MAGRHCSHGQNRNKVFNLPVRRNKICRGENDHANDTDKGECHAPLEFGKDLRNLNEEIRKLGFLGSSTPRHVDFKHVSE